MILAIDVGNTNIVFGCIENQKILFTERLSTDHAKTAFEYAISFHNILEIHQIDTGDITGAIIASVVPPITSHLKEAVYKVTGVDTMVVGPGIRTGLNIRMDNPAQVGADLIVGAVAGIAQYPCPLVLVDMGTATTITVIDEKKNYIGGMILPGIRVSLDSLTSRTSQLPRISLDPPKNLIGTNTIDCMRSGILYGNAACLDGMIDRIRGELPEEPTIVATGGLAKVIVPLCRNHIILDDDLLLRGLMLIYEKNAG
ncbi:MAG: type III pantothenate kinase [Lachnospiraceae bacterium]|nr:type III pantothenate kinase [Lachnospiraceae bacterium]